MLLNNFNAHGNDDELLLLIPSIISAIPKNFSQFIGDDGKSIMGYCQYYQFWYVDRPTIFRRASSVGPNKTENLEARNDAEKLYGYPCIEEGPPFKVQP